MSAQQSTLPTGIVDSDVDEAMQGRLLRRATHLCLRAEPHTDQSPCRAHVSEANRQLLRLSG